MAGLMMMMEIIDGDDHDDDDNDGHQGLNYMNGSWTMIQNGTDTEREGAKREEAPTEVFSSGIRVPR